LEGVSRLDLDEKHVIKEIVEGILLKHQAKRLITPQASKPRGDRHVSVSAEN
jgi:hypothetical protein